MKTTLILITVALLGFSSCTKIAKEPINPTTEEVNETHKIKYGYVLFTTSKPGLMTVITSNQYTYSKCPIRATGVKCEDLADSKYEVHPAIQSYTVYTTKIDENFNSVADSIYKKGSINVAPYSCNTINID